MLLGSPPLFSVFGSSTFSSFYIKIGKDPPCNLFPYSIKKIYIEIMGDTQPRLCMLMLWLWGGAPKGWNISQFERFPNYYLPPYYQLNTTLKQLSSTLKIPSYQI
jgi:hypothetical protein